MAINWWQARKHELLNLVQDTCPLYVYNEETLNDIFFDLLSIDVLQGLFYPVRANPHQQIIRKAFEMDMGFLCTSINELRGLLDQLPKLNPQRILFLLDDDPEESLIEEIFQSGTRVIIKNLQILKACPEAFKDKEVFIFLDPGTRSEAGLWTETRVKGFYQPLKMDSPPSNEVNKSSFPLIKVSRRFPKAKTLILGNSMDAGITCEQVRMDIRDLKNYLAALNETESQFILWIEVPYHMIASTGALLTKVIETGVKKGKHYVRMNMDVKALICHKFPVAGIQIFNLSRLDEKKTIMTRVMGQNQGFDHEPLLTIPLPFSVQEDDILLITNRGMGNPSAHINGKDQYMRPEHYLSARRICQVRI